MRNLSKVEDPDRYYNWYHGYTDIEFQTFDKYSNNYKNTVTTCAPSGNVKTQYFGEEFDRSDCWDDTSFVGCFTNWSKFYYNNCL